jgi:response regulator of citrate/malate metabolism
MARVQRGTSGNELQGAETIFNHEKPDMELPDIHLPGKSGIELLIHQESRKVLLDTDDNKPGR